MPISFTEAGRLEIERAEAFATAKHAGQFRRNGVTPYIEHPRRVALRVRRLGVLAVVVAWLHDVVEDCGVTLDELRAAGFSEAVVRAVDDLSQRIRLAGTPVTGRWVSVGVKIADIVENSVDAGSSPSEVDKYTRALWMLAGFPPSLIS